MKVARFGHSAWASAYTFGDALMEDTWASARPVLTAQVGGAGGVFDFNHSVSSPPVPLVLKKKFALTAATSSAIEDALDTLRGWTLAQNGIRSRTMDRSYLWFLDRDGTTKYWMWAKCTKLAASENYREKGRWMKVVDLEFFCQEGLWYSEAEQTDDSGVITGAYGSSAVNNLGNYPALVKMQIDVDATSAVAMTSCTGGATYATWAFGGTVAIGNTLSVDANIYRVTNNAAVAYSDFTPGQLVWCWLMEVGNDYISFDPTPNGTKHRCRSWWYNTYIF